MQVPNYDYPGWLKRQSANKMYFRKLSLDGAPLKFPLWFCRAVSVQFRCTCD